MAGEARGLESGINVIGPSPSDVVVPLLFRTHAPAASATTARARDAYIEAGVVGGDAVITISRQSPDDVGFREIFVSVDGTPIGILKHGDAITQEVAAGTHRLRAHNTLFWKTHDVAIRPGEHVHFTAINRAGFGTFGMLFVIGAMPVYLTFERAGASPARSAG